MRIYKSVVFGLLAVLAFAQPAFADERILSFDSTITVNSDGTLEVREAIRVRAEGNKIRRGIYRDFPTDYEAKDGRLIVVGFAFQSATRDGQPETWRREDRGNGVRIYLGSASVMLPQGEHTYEIVYTTDRQMGYFADHDELYWNVTGNGWDFAIDRATARVILPDDIPRADVKIEAYTGPQGSKGDDYTARIDDNAPFYSTTRGLGAREGLTIVAMWPKGFIMPAVESSQPLASGQTSSPGYDFARDGGQSAAEFYGSPAEAFLHRDLPNDKRPALFGVVGLALLLFYYYRVWDKVGRDPPGRVIIPEYEMPKAQSAASMRYLLQMSYDNECFAAAILSLAVKGYLRIQQNSKVLGIGKKFSLIKETAPSGKPLNDDEQALLANLFADGDVLELENENHEIVSGARSSHRTSLKSKYTAGFFAINGGWHFLGIALSLLVGAFALSFPGAAPMWPEWYFTTPLGWFTIATVIGALVANGVFGKLLKAPTVAGRAAMDHIQGFKMYLEVAEGEDLKRINAPPPPKMTPELFERYLPAALALGVQQRWSERFARALQLEAPNYHPAWYVGSGWNAANIGNFSSQLGSSLSSAISSASQAPGSSSGGGGGGSSGGGGGGGGGGGW